MITFTPLPQPINIWTDILRRGGWNMPRRSSDNDDIIWKAIAVVAAFLIILGLIIAISKVLWILFLVIAIFSYIYWYYSRDEMALNICVVSLIICTIFVIIGFVIGDTEIGKTSQEFYSMAVNISRVKLNP
jgi:hypothetical protein